MFTRILLLAGGLFALSLGIERGIGHLNKNAAPTYLVNPADPIQIVSYNIRDMSPQS